MMILSWLKGIFARRTGRMLGGIAGIALTMTLLSSIGSFISWSGASMTSRAIANVPVDWQIQIVPGTPLQSVLDALNKATAVTAIETTGYADVTGLQSTTGNSVQQTGAGKVVGVSADYIKKFPSEFRYLVGGRAGVLITQQAAANLHVQPGDTVTVQRVGLPPADVKIDGVIDLPFADSFFQAIGLPPNAASQAPPDNVLILPDPLWHSLFDAQSLFRPDSVRTQLHVRIAHAFPSDPDSAYLYVARLANNLEARIAGNGLVGNNLAARLSTVRTDALYARVLFLFLGLPGAVLAVLLVLFIAASGEKHRKREQTLLQSHGASLSRILHLQSVEAFGTAGFGIIAGSVLSFWIDGLLVPFGPATAPLIYAWIAFSAVAGIILALSAVIVPAWQSLRNGQEVLNGNGRVVVKPLWKRVFLDVILLILSGVEFWRTASSGYTVVMAPEGVASISVNYEAFIGPFFLWIGGVLLALRLFDGLIGSRPELVSGIIWPVSGALSPTVASSLSRDRKFLARGILLVSLAVSFAVSTSIFNTTYNRQARVDAELTNGSDVTVTPLVPFSKDDSRLKSVASVPGIAGMQLMQHRFAYVGKDLQDLYGIDPANIGKATHVSDAFFGNKNAKATLATLGTMKDGVLVSEETINDFQLKTGDLINLRLQFSSDNAYHVVPFHIAGTVREFPTAPKDSFFVANASYIARVTGTPASEVLLLRSAGNPQKLAASVSGVLGAGVGKVSEIGSVQRIISSGITSVDLRGLTSLELIFAIILLVCSVALVLALGMAERRRNFAVLKMIGAGKKEMDAFIRGEVLVIFTGGMLAGIILGLGVAQMLVKVLSGVFDPPPEFLSIPWNYLIVLFVTALLSAIASSAGISILSRRPAVEELRSQE
jgi:putative ABC transport system permease protein